MNMKFWISAAFGMEMNMGIFGPITTIILGLLD